ncbi:hypothetical protein F4820DRAFT_466164 [Hypoxylon rubiginosum]|uniref:Uncharacterized protein n=1 Tax=Hypoxylon rubiginosum TaxID=110542 RepID=A0ACB9YLG8_9PEZI|nr:hypothetical protein F4820DRAFT_466164 [Hypoxylon rubiginosum]
MDNALGPSFDISNGTCFYMENSLATVDYIPCGNVAVGSNWQCCVAGDICVEENACRSPGGPSSYYLAGCTDPSFGSNQCPDKGDFGSQQYVPLVDCNDDYSGCFSEKDAPGDDGDDPPCTCDPKSVLFSNPFMESIALLPSSLGGSISWYDGMEPTPTSSHSSPSSSPKPKVTSTSTSTSASPTHSPTHSPTQTSSSSSSDTRATDSSTSTPASTLSSGSSVEPLPTTTVSPDGTPVVSESGTPDSSTTSGSSPSTAMYIGVGVGVSVGAILIGCLLYLALLLRKRKRMRQNDNDSDPMAYLGQPTIPVLPPAPPGNDEYPTGTAFSAFRPELAAEGPKKGGASMITTSSGPNSPGSSLAHQPQSPQQPPQRQYQAYNPIVHGNYAERRESARSASEVAGSVSSSSPKPQEHGQQGNQSPAPAELSTPTHIHELAG